MSKKISYIISINGGAATGKAWTYDYGQTKEVRLYIQKQKAVICFEQGIKKSHEDLITFKVKLFRDAYRKVYMLHAILYDTGLAVKHMEIRIDGVSKSYDDASENFPFLFSMIKNKKQNLSDGWKKYMLAPVLSIPKSKKDTDLRFCAAFSFLAAKNRDYRIDRFTNLWTAMNAYGNYLAKRYEGSLAKLYDMENASNTVKGVVEIYGKDGVIVDLIARFISKDAKTHSRAEVEEFWDTNYDVQKALDQIPKGDYKELYEEAKKVLDPSYVLPEKYQALQDSIASYGQPLFVFLITDYPYYLRCHYLHGSFSTILFSSYNDYELNSLGVVNYFLERFLDEIIPEIFKSDFWSEEKYEEVKDCLKVILGKEDNGRYRYERRGLEKLTLKS